MSADEKPLKVIVLTGGSGRTGQQVVEAALAQFKEPNAEVTVQTNVRHATAARKVVRQAKADGSIICHTLVSPKIRDIVRRETETLMVPTVDVLGPVVSLISDHLGVESHNQPGLSYELNKEQFDRIDAVDFCLAHDDGHRLEEFDAADVVIVGVSRASKSVTCLFLAYRGIRAANVPIVPEVGPAAELLEIDPRKIIALTMNAHRLQKLRAARGERWGTAMKHYSDPGQVAREVRAFETLVAKQRWRCVDVSYQAVEEVASGIARMIGREARVAS